MGSRIRSTDNQIPNQNFVPSQTVHDRMRDQLSKDVEAFLARGGEIKHLEPHMRSNLGDSDSDVDTF
ncbi:hypothetical protein AB4876_03070 [Zhongshania guokunii]|uniref:Transcriptional regulator SutA RNAP-binding domain-containing protein n=1 Tax=Zhongshania guokunii TaxID=641783 RepID=A0ABV3U302_9GAMM